MGLAIRTPRDYTGIVSIVVSAKGTDVTLGEIDLGNLPPCVGRPKT
jgi:hypothetical protein